MEVEEEEEKYAKARRQSRGGLLVVVAILVVCAGLASYLRHNKRKQSRPQAGGSPSLRQNDELGFTPPAKKKTKSIAKLQDQVVALDEVVRDIKSQVDIFETDKTAQKAAKQLQDATRELLVAMYGAREPYRVHVELEFQPTIPDFAEKGKDGHFVIELAPSRLVPHSVYTFLEIARQWNLNGGAFHRIAGHVLQVMVKTRKIKHLAFQEYSPEYPHKERTVGYAGRPSGPAWYVSIQDNSRNHGPGSQQKHNPYEADAAIGRVIEGYEESVLRITKVPGSGFLGDTKKHVIIKSMTIMVPDSNSNEDDEYVKWIEPKEIMSSG